MAGQPSNDELFAAALKDTPSVLSVALGEGASTTLPSESGVRLWQAMIRDPFYWSSKGPAETFQSSRMQHAESARSTGWPIAIRLFAASRSCSGLIKLSCPLSQRKRFALPKEQQPTCLRHQTRVARRLSDNPPASTTSASATSKYPRMVAGGVYLKFRHFNKAAYIPAWKVLAGEVPQEEIEGRIILVGTSAPGLLDLRATPVDAAVPGIDIHAQVLEHLLTGKFLERPDYALALEEFVILALGMMLAFALPRVSAKASAAIGLLTIALVLMGGWAAFRYWRTSFSIRHIQHSSWAA